MDLLKKILSYEDYIKLSSKIFKEVFSINSSPILACREGKVPKMGSLIYKNYKLDFHFHGIGCRCTYNQKVIVDFDYRFEMFDYKGFEIYKLLLFIHSSSNYKNKMTINELTIALSSLEKQGLLQKNADNNIDTYDYFIKQE